MAQLIVVLSFNIKPAAKTEEEAACWNSYKFDLLHWTVSILYNFKFQNSQLNPDLV